MTLGEALANVEIQLIPGRVYNFVAGGCQMELRVQERSAASETKTMNLEGEQMLSAWTDLPVGPALPVQSIRKVSPPLPEPLAIFASDLAPS